MSDEVFHGWYNRLSSSTVFYLSEDGKKEVEVSFVERDYDAIHEKRNVYRGKVSKYVRVGRRDIHDIREMRLIDPSYSMGKKIPSEDLGGISSENLKDLIDIHNAMFGKLGEGEACPLKYYGVGVCKCGNCNTVASVRKGNANPFGYTDEEKKPKKVIWSIHDEPPPPESLPPTISWQDQIRKHLKAKYG